MSTLKELRNERLKKLEKLQSLGYNPYPDRANRTVMVNEISDDFEAFDGKVETVFGRIKV